MNNILNLVNPEMITDNSFKLIGSDWMLVTAGNVQKFNTMTASWGGLGILWNKKVCFVVVRPSRYTYQFMEGSQDFTLSFFEERYRDALTYCGTKSGRNVDKIKDTGLTPAETTQGSVYFGEARLVLECRKLFYQDMDPANFLDPGIEKNYNGKDYHRLYVGEILGCYMKER